MTQHSPVKKINPINNPDNAQTLRTLDTPAPPNSPKPNDNNVDYDTAKQAYKIASKAYTLAYIASGTRTRQQSDEILALQIQVQDLRLIMDEFNNNPIIGNSTKCQSSLPLNESGTTSCFPPAAYRVPSNLPSFNPNSASYGDTKFSNPRDFLTRFQIIMTASSIPESAWIKILPLCLSNNEATWVATLNCNNFIDFKCLFLTHFTNPLQSRTNRANLYSARIHRDETIQQFTDRFCELVRICELTLDSEEVIEYYRAALPLQLQQELNHIMITVQVVNPEQKFDVAELSKFAIAHDAINSTRQNLHQKQNSNIKYNNSFQNSTNTNSVTTCNYCKLPGHNEQQCRGKQKDIRNGTTSNRNKSQSSSAINDTSHHRKNQSLHPSSSSANRTGLNQYPRANTPSVPPANYVCNKCKVPGHWIQNCASPSVNITHFKQSDQQLPPCQTETTEPATNSTTMKLPTSLPETNYMNSFPAVDCLRITTTYTSTIIPTTVSNGITPGIVNNTKRKLIFVPLTINGILLQGLVDSGADSSCISHEFATKNNLLASFVAISGVSQSAFTTHPRIGRLTDLTLGFNSNSHKIHLELIKSNIDMIIGLDLFDCLQIFVGPLPYKSDFIPNSDFVCDVKDPNSHIVFEATPFDPHSISQWSDLLKTNESLSPYSRCSLPACELHIPTGNHPPIYRPQYKIPFAYYDQVTAKIQTWFKKKVIVQSPIGNRWNFPLMVTAKKDSEGKLTDIRLCMDPRAINAIIPDNNHPLDSIREIFDNLSGMSYFTTLDLQEAFLQFPVAEQDQHKLAFTWLGIQYNFTVAPFGIKTVPSHVSAVLKRALFNTKQAQMYLDDLLSGSATEYSHVEDVSRLLSVLNNANLRLRIPKCFFMQRKIRLLGHIVSDKGLSPDPRKLLALSLMPEPTTPALVRTFMGSVTYYSAHIPNLAQLAAPLNAVRMKDSFSWTEQHQLSFDSIKKILISAPITLAFPDLSRPVYLTCDASLTAYGCLITQPALHPDQPEFLISCYSRTTSPSEKNYSPTNLELSCLCWALIRTRQYTLGRKFTVYTDHQALSFMFSQRNLNPMLERYMNILLQFDFECIYKPGKENLVVDVLSRISPNINTIQDNQSGSLPLFTDLEKQKFLTEAHSLGHFGIESMFNQLRNRNIWWSGLRSDLQDLLHSCSACQRHSISRRGYHPLHSIEAKLPIDHLAIDLIGPLPSSQTSKFKYILVVLDIFTKFIVLRPLKDKSATEVTSQLFSIFSLIDFPHTLQSDNGTEFINNILHELTTLTGIDHRSMSPYHPRANGAVERTNTTIIAALKKHVQGFDASWSQWLSFVQFSYNSRVQTTTGSTPFTLLFNRSPYPTIQSQERRSTIDINQDTSHITTKDYSYWKSQHKNLISLIYPAVNARISATRKKSMESFQRSNLIINNPYPLGALVMLYNHTRASKLEAIYEGPFKIIHTDRNFTYTLMDNASNTRSKVPISHLKLVSKVPIDNSVIPLSFSQAIGDSADIETILAHSPFEQTFDYLVRWKDPTHSDSWIAADNFDDIQIIRDYWKHINNNKGSKSKQTPTLPKSSKPRISTLTLKKGNVGNSSSIFNQWLTQPPVLEMQKPLL